MNEFLVSAIILLAVFTQSLSGFGTGLVAMPLLVGVIDVRLAAPLVALVSIVTNATLLAMLLRKILLRMSGDCLLTRFLLLLGLLAGVFLSRYVNPSIFRKIILVLIAVIGMRLIL